VSTATAPTRPDVATPPECAHCGAPLESDQEWCLECGVARTLVHSPPDWRVPLAIIGTVVLLGLAALAIALINLSASADRTAASAVKQTRTAAAPLPAAPVRPTTAPANPHTLATWPVGLPGWTVILASKRHQAKAQAYAKGLLTAGLSVGILYSSRYPALPAGRWIVFLGRYPTRAAAQAKSTALIARGYKAAHVHLVAKPGA